MNWSAYLMTHRKEQRIAIVFPYDKQLVERIKKVVGARYSLSQKVWHVPDTDENRVRFKIEPRLILNEEHVQKKVQFKGRSSAFERFLR